MPKLSIIIPTFKSAGTIQRCLDSIRVQIFTDYEIVVQDGGSSDRTTELIEQFRRENPGIKLELEQGRDKGVYDAMNKAMRRASGEWLFFLGSDDEFYNENVLDKVLCIPEAADCDVLYGNAQIVGIAGWAEDGAIYDGPFDLSKLLTKNICHQALFYRAAFAREIGDYNQEYVVCADWDFNMRCWAKGQFKYVDVLVAKFHGGGNSSNARPDPHFEADLTTNIIQYFGKGAERARRPSRFTPRRVLGALVRRLGSTR
jgi:glycosyltransferase involved in cell wall biosynthesis